MTNLNTKNMVYVDDIINLHSFNDDKLNIINCPTSNMSIHLNNDGRSFDYNKINRFITNPSYRSNDTNNAAMPFKNIPKCSSDIDFSGCCVIQTEFSNNDYIDYCDRDSGKKGTSTGFMYKVDDTYHNVCHAQKIQDKVSIFSNYQNKKDGLEKFFMVLLVSIVMILFYTLLSLPYEFWLRYGNSIECIYYKVKQTCKNMGSDENDGKLSIIDYKFPDNLHKYPYEACQPITSGGMKGGREKEGSINSNFIKYYETESKCITVDFGDDPDDIYKRPFPYNLGEYANTKVKNNYIAMILKGFSFYFLFTILLLRTAFNKGLSFFSKQFQKIYKKNTIISSLLLLLNFIITPFLIISTLVSVIFAGISVFPIYITIADLFKPLFDINYFSKDIETSPSTDNNPSYYKIYKLKPLFYLPKDVMDDNNDTDFHKKNMFFAIVIGLIVAFGVSQLTLGIQKGNNTSYITEGEENFSRIFTLISFIFFPALFWFISKKITNFPREFVKVLDMIKIIFLNLLLCIPVFFTIIFTFAAGMTGSILAGLYMILKLLFDFYVTSYSNSMEFLDLLKNHSKLLTIILLICVITSSAMSGLGSQVTGTLGGLLALYLIYELYKIS